MHQPTAFIQAYIHAHIHAYIHTYIRTYVHTSLKIHSRDLNVMYWPRGNRIQYSPQGDKLREHLASSLKVDKKDRHGQPLVSGHPGVNYQCPRASVAVNMCVSVSVRE